MERMFAHYDGVAFASPLRLRDKDTGRLREHDIVITRTTHHGPNLTAIECKDHGRKVGVPQVEQFAKKCDKTGIHRGVIVAANGFTRTAVIKAKALNLTCMELADAETFAWIGEITVVGLRQNFLKIEAYVAIEPDGRDLVHPTTVYDPDGAVYVGEDAQSFIIRQLPENSVAPEDGQITTGQAIKPLGGFYVIDAAGQRFGARDITFCYTLKTEVKRQVMTLHRYADDEAAMEIASAEIVFDEGRSTVMFTKTEDGVTGYGYSVGAADHIVRIKPREDLVRPSQ